MLRILNVVSVVILIGSAVYAYSVKYETLYQAERISKLKRELQSEEDAIAMLRAEWANVSRPERIQELADKYLDGQQLALTQIVAPNALPDRVSRGDEIGRKLEDLGLDAPTNTPSASAATTTPSAPVNGKR